MCQLIGLIFYQPILLAWLLMKYLGLRSIIEKESFLSFSYTIVLIFFFFVKFVNFCRKSLYWKTKKKLLIFEDINRFFTKI